MTEMGLVQCKTDPCVWKLVKETSQGPQLQVLVLLQVDDFMSAGRKGEAGWEQGHVTHDWSRRLTTSGRKLCDGQKAHVDSIDPAEIKPERRKTPEASVTERENPHCEV